MAITAVTERRGYDHSYGVGKYAPERRHTRSFWVYSDSRTETPEAVRTATGIPQFGDVLASDAGVRVVGYKLRREEDQPKRWEVEVEYSSYSPGDQEEPPDIETQTRISIITEQGNVLLQQDINGDAIKNTAGDFIEGLEMPWNNLGMRIEQAVTGTPDYSTLSTWVNAISSTTWRGIPAYFAQIRSINYESDIIEGVQAWRRVVEVKIANSSTQPWGFRLRLLNAGLRQWTGSKLDWCKDEGSQLRVSKPVPLAADGTQLPRDGTPIFLDFQVYPELDFNSLGI